MIDKYKDPLRDMMKEEERQLSESDKELEERIKRKESERDIDDFEIEQRKDIKEQMRQRSRYLSKHCRK